MHAAAELDKLCMGELYKDVTIKPLSTLQEALKVVLGPKAKPNSLSKPLLHELRDYVREKQKGGRGAERDEPM